MKIYFTCKDLFNIGEFCPYSTIGFFIDISKILLAFENVRWCFIRRKNEIKFITEMKGILEEGEGSVWIPWIDWWIIIIIGFSSIENMLINMSMTIGSFLITTNKIFDFSPEKSVGFISIEWSILSEKTKRNWFTFSLSLS